MRRDEKDPLSGLRASKAPPELAEPVLAAARGALAARAEQSLWDRAWNSATLRFAWGIVTILLLAAHALVTIAPRRAATEPARKVARTRPAAVDFASIANLPRIDPDALGPVFEALGKPKSGLPR